MMRATPLYPEFFENVSEACHEHVAIEAGEQVATDTLVAVSGAAPWVGRPLPPDEHEVVFAPTPGPASPAWERPVVPFVVGEQTVDAIAAYFPWHFYGDNWGIRIYEAEFFGFVAEFTERLDLKGSGLNRIVLQQVLHHEWTHFAFEVVATELEDAIGRPLYGDYSRYRYSNASDFSTGPLEEVVATWSELVFARSSLPVGLKPKPRGYVRAMREINRAAPPGYCDFEVMRNHSDWIVSELAGLIADRAMWTQRWGNVTREETSMVPLYWVGSEAGAAAAGIAPKSVAPPSIRELEGWLRRVGATIDRRRGKGGHRGFSWRGRSSFYETSGDRLSRKTAASLAAFFGLAGPHELFVYVRELKQP